MPQVSGADAIESCLACKLRGENTFCHLPNVVLQSLDALKHTITYPKGAILFTEGENPRGVFVLCKGRVKLSISSSRGKALVPRIAQPGEVLGLSGTVLGQPHEVTAETIGNSQVNFVKRGDFLAFLRAHPEVCFRVAEQLSEKYASACRYRSSLSLPRSLEEKLAKLLLLWASTMKDSPQRESALGVEFTHEIIAEMIGTRRETVTRLLSRFKKREIVQPQGSVLVIRNESELRRMAGA